MATFAPSSANKLAVRRPMPCVAPVISTFLSLKPKSILFPQTIIAKLLLAHCAACSP